MKYAFIADIHANLAALDAVLAKIDTLGCDKILCLGDVVGYNASPAECIERLIARKIFTLSGNHDRYAATGEVDDVRPESLVVIDWTREHLTPEQLKWLSKLPDQHTLDGNYLLVHGSPLDRDEYLLKPPQWQSSLKAMRTTFFGLDLCFFGHTHYPMVIAKGMEETDIKVDRTIALKRGNPTLINPGAVGQPRDGCPKASFCVHDSSAYNVTYYRVDYDIADTQRRLAEAKLPKRHGDRLALGK